MHLALNLETAAAPAGGKNAAAAPWGGPAGEGAAGGAGTGWRSPVALPAWHFATGCLASMLRHLPPLMEVVGEKRPCTPRHRGGAGRVVGSLGPS